MNVIEEKEALNKINVFPVADGDTGSNLAALMQSIVDQVNPESASVNKTLQSIAEASLIGARGNSGIIFAQYLNAVARVFEQGERTVLGFVYSFSVAVKDAYQALLEPQEGTILTVMSVWSEALYVGFLKEEVLEKALLSAEEAASEAVQQTRYQLNVLRHKRLVDAGAKGFYHFIEGFTNTYCDTKGKSRLASDDRNEHVDFLEIDNQAERPNERYCSEFLLKEVIVDTVALKEKLSKYGDSLIIVGEGKLVKIHIHTNKPKDVLIKLEQYGVIVSHKVDDMLLQWDTANTPKYPIAIVTDSIADIPQELLLEEQIHVLPIQILTDTTSYLDKQTIDSSIIREKIQKKEKLSTSQPSIQSVDALLSFLEGKYREILIITVSAKLSGTYQLIKQRIEVNKLNQAQVHVIDSKLNAAAQGLLVLSAVNAIKKGESFEQVVTTVLETITRSFIYVSVASLAPMVESGRIPKKIGRIAQRLNVYPIVTLDSDGDGKLKGISFSQESATKKMLKQVHTLIAKSQLEAFAITHVDNAERANEIGKSLFDNQDGRSHYIVESSAAIAISAGIGAIAVAGIKVKEEL
nr:DegV family protein [Enterococcus alcedinis]